MPDAFDWPSFLPEFSAAARAQGFRAEVLVDTGDGSLVAWERKGAGAPLYLSAGIHGDEPAGPLAALELMRSGSFPPDRHVLVCPALNPGGLATGSRGNRQGLDLNRDYLLQKSLEIAAHARWLSRKPIPSVFVSLHEDWETEGFYFYEINMGKDDPARYESILDSVSPFFPPEPGPEIDGHAARAPGWIFHSAEADLPDAWPEAIWLAKHGCPLSFTFETPSRADLSKRVRAHLAGLEAVLRSVATEGMRE